MRDTRQPLDTYDYMPEGMVNYMRHYGRHFSRKMYEFAVSNMRNEEGEEMKPITREKFNSVIEKNNIKLENDVLYDGMFVMSMAMSDFFGSSLPDEAHVALYVKDYIDDPDQADGFVFNRFYADCVLKGVPIDWEDML